MSTDRGFTGQHADAVTGLDYYNARYYGPKAGQFSSADTIMDGTNRYDYVGGNPETLTDPTGKCIEDACIGEIALAWLIWTAATALVAYVAAYDVAHPMHWPGWPWQHSTSPSSTSTGRTAVARE
jgi:RHS repeat-associated protein